MIRSKCGWLLLLVVAQVSVFAQSSGPATTERPSNENGAATFYTTGGWSFGFPAVRAFVSIPGVGTAISPEKKTLPMLGAGVGVTAWKFLVPFAEFSAIDTGKATAQVGSVQATGQANTFMFHGGLRLIGGHSRLRPYAQFGGGMLHQGLSGAFSVSGNSAPVSGSASVGSVMYGGGLQFFAGRKWGSVIGYDGYHVDRPLNGAGQNYGGFHLGIFYQTKSAVN
jgi:hypothetical protein